MGFGKFFFGISVVKVGCFLGGELGGETIEDMNVHVTYIVSFAIVGFTFKMF